MRIIKSKKSAKNVEKYQNEYKIKDIGIKTAEDEKRQRGVWQLDEKVRLSAAFSLKMKTGEKVLR